MITESYTKLCALAAAVVDAYCAWQPDDVPEDFETAIADLGWAARERIVSTSAHGTRVVILPNTSGLPTGEAGTIDGPISTDGHQMWANVVLDNGDFVFAGTHEISNEVRSDG